MNQSTRAACLQACAIAVPLLCAHAPSAVAAVPAPSASCPPVVALDARLAAEGEAGVVPLRRYVDRTRMIHQLDLADAMVRIDRYRGARAGCTTMFED